MGKTAVWLIIGLAVVATLAPADAYYLDPGRNFDVRLRAYAQLGILTESSETTGCQPLRDATTGKIVFKQDPRTCPPKYSAGDLAQERNFYNPEFDAKLTDYMQWAHDVPGLSLIAPDDLKFRFAWWGFYDGIYDYLNPEWDTHRRNLKGRFSQSNHVNRESYFFNDENRNPRHIYASRNRINELYLDYTKGRVFFRVGRQAISWGEADTIALLDISNPFDLTLAAPGLFQDVDEARIPLWTLRTTIKLIDSWKFISSGFLDAYMVPGIIDTTIPNDPITGGVSAFNPDVPDPQGNLAAGPTTDFVISQSNQLHVSVVDHLPENEWRNTRWGARLTGVLFRDYTVQGWFFRTFNQAPAPLLSSIAAFDFGTDVNNLTLVDNRGFRTPVCIGADGKKLARNFGGTLGRTPAGRSCSWKAPVVTTLNRRLENVIGLAGTWFSQPVNGIIRTEMELMLDELAFIPTQNLNPRTQLPRALRPANEKGLTNTIATADYVRWLVGYDRFFFFRPLNPTNSFIVSMAFNSSFNLSEGNGKDYRYPYTKPGRRQAEAGPIPGNASCRRGTNAQNNPLCVRANPRAFENAYRYEGFLQTALQTDYMHGKLSPRLVLIQDVSGIFTFVPSVNYRVTDNVLLSANYIAIAATRKANAGVFRAHDMVQMRVTFQLN